MERLLRSWVLVLAGALAACGGGGGDGDGGAARVSVDATTLNVSTIPSDDNLGETLTVSLSKGIDSDVYVNVEFSENGIQNIEFIPVNAVSAELRVHFRAGVDLNDGVYSDTITIEVCKDTQCNQHLPGSPMQVRSTMTVSSSLVASLDKSQINISVPNTRGTVVTESVKLSVTGGSFPDSTLTVRPSNVGTGVVSVQPNKVSATEMRLDFMYGTPNERAFGIYNDTVTLDVCYDSRCRRPVAGSPFVVNSVLEIVNVPQPDPGLSDMPVVSSTGLAHDVVDAEYSNGLDAIVMVSSWPENALYIHNGQTGAETKVALTKLPKSVSVAPDGRSAAVGHDGLVTHVDLVSLATKPLNVSANVGDLVLDGRGKVYVFPATDQWVSVHTIDVAANTETLVYGPRAGTLARLHPSGNSLYAANNGLSPDDIENYDISTGVASKLRDSPYHGDYPMCGNLWLSDDGVSIYTACGRTFRTSAIAGSDMVYSGAMTLGSSDYFGSRIRSLSQRSSLNQIVVVEDSGNPCEMYSGNQWSCWSRLSFFSSDYLALTARYAINPIEVNARLYEQRGLFVFHRNDGRKLVVTRLIAMSNPAAEYFVRVVQ